MRWDTELSTGCKIITGKIRHELLFQPVRRDATQKRAMFLHYVGEETWDVVDMLLVPETPKGSDEHQTLLKALADHFEQQNCFDHHLYVFWQESQKTVENITEFYTTIHLNLLWEHLKKFKIMTQFKDMQTHVLLLEYIWISWWSNLFLTKMWTIIKHMGTTCKKSNYTQVAPQCEGDCEYCISSNK